MNNLIIDTEKRSNFLGLTYVIQGQVFGEWKDTKYQFELLHSAIECAQNWIEDDSRWMGGENDLKKLRIVRGKP